MEVISPAFAAVVAADHPSPECGGPCATCAFRPGTDANRTGYTTLLAQLCIEGLTPFDCHEHKRWCRGWVAAVNLLAAAGELPHDIASLAAQRGAEHAADVLAEAIEAGVQADIAAGFVAGGAGTGRTETE